MKTDFRYLELSNTNQVAIISPEDTWVYRYNWYLHNKGYVCRSEYREGKVLKILLHREITQAPKGILVDHENQNKLDNTRTNLRLCQHKQNLANRTKTKANTSGFKGVFTHGDRFKVQIDHHHVGVFDSARLAAIVYNLHAKRVYDEFACLNIL